MPILPDVLAPGLKVVFCGLTAGSAAAEAGAYYAGPGNWFWPLLFELGLTPRALCAAEYRDVLEFGLGLTNLAAEHAGDEADLPGITTADRQAFDDKVREYTPRVVAFTSRRAAEEYYGYPTNLGHEHCARIHGAQPFVLPSTSAGARRFYEPSYWQALADFVRTMHE